MSWPRPVPGLVIRYSYLWATEAEAGREEGVKDRPCAVIIVVFDADEQPKVRVLPITHVPPANPEDGLEIPQATKARLGLDDERSWLILTEANDFRWPGPDLRPRINGVPASVAFGTLPNNFMRRLFSLVAGRQVRAVRRTQ